MNRARSSSSSSSCSSRRAEARSFAHPTTLRAGSAVCFLLAALAGVLSAPAAPATALVSSKPRNGATGTGGSFQPALSADGRFVAFVSQANDLVTNDNSFPFLDVFLHDRQSGAITLLSISTNGHGGGDNNSVGPSISGDGRFIAFQSAAGNLAPNDTNAASDIFLHDRLAGTTQLISRERNGRTAFHLASAAPSLTPDGRWLVFESDATDLVPNDTNGATDIFLFDRESGTTTLVSVNGRGGGGSGASLAPAITPDGRWVAFLKMTNISAGLPPISHVYVRDLQAGRTLWASSNAAAQIPAYQGASPPVLSADGSAVFFHASGPASTNLYRFDLNLLVSTRISSAAQVGSAPSPSADGRYVAYEGGKLVRIWDAQTSNEVIVNVTELNEPAPSSTGPARPALSANGTKVTFLNGGSLTGPANGWAQLYQRDLTANTTRLLSGDASGAPSGDVSACVPSVTADGSVVAFESTSDSLVPDDFNLAPDVFVRDVAGGSTALVSRREAELPSVTAVALGTLYPNSVSANGRWVAFGSLDLGATDTNGVRDIFVRDLQTGVLDPISVNAAGEFTNLFNSYSCTLSADGRYVAYATGVPDVLGYSSVYWRDRQTGETKIISNGFEGPFFSRNGAPAISPDARWVAFETTRPTSFIEPGLGDANFIGSDIVLHDTLAGTNTVISRNWAGTATGNGPSSEPQFSPDGRWLAFASFATDLTTNIPSGSYRRLFVHDLVQRTTLDVSFGPSEGMPGSIQLYAGQAVFSADSRFLAYNATDNLVGLYDLVTGIRSNVCFQCKNPAMTADGRLLAVETFIGTGIGGSQKIMLIDRISGRTSLIGTNLVSGVVPPSFAPSRSPVLSGDGRYLIFLANLPYDPSTGGLLRPRLYLRDLARGLTQLLPLDLNGGPGDGPSYVPQLAADGRTLVFASFASDLVAGDFNTRRDVFALRIGGPDSDYDGLDDDWEVAYFGDLSRDGTGDLDQDGQTDRAEFLAGTDPTNRGSVLSVTLVTPLPPESVMILWQSVPGRVYDVQYKDGLTDEWSTLFAHVIADSATRSVVDNLLPWPEHRFYRVVFTPN